MIFDKVENFELYKNCHKEFYQVEKFLKEVSEDIEPGRYELENGVYVNVDLTNTRYEGPLEAHKKYIDIQVGLTGEEIIEYANISGLEIYKEDISRPEDDLYFYNTPSKTSFLIDKNHFAVFFPEDLHKPLLVVDNKMTEIKKLVFKIPVEN